MTLPICRAALRALPGALSAVLSAVLSAALSAVRPAVRPATWFATLFVTLAGCAAAPPTALPANLAPPAALLLQGVPPVPGSLVAAVERYTEFAGHSLVDWHPSRREMLVSHRPAGGNTNQLYRVSGPGATPEALTDGSEPVSQAWYVPGPGNSIVLARGTGGNEAYQLYRLDVTEPCQPGSCRPDTPPPGTTQTLLSDPDQRHEFNVWLHRSSLAIVASVPLDRTARGGTRATVNTTLWLLDPARPGQRRVLAELPGGGWQASAVSPDDRQAALLRYISATETEVWLLDLASGQRRRVLPAAGLVAGVAGVTGVAGVADVADVAGVAAVAAVAAVAGVMTDTAPGATAAYLPGQFTADGQRLLVLSDQAGEFRELAVLHLASGTLQRVTSHIPWDVEAAEPSADGSLLALQINADGKDTLYLFDGRTLRAQALPAGAVLPPGSVGRLLFRPQGNTVATASATAPATASAHELAFSVSNAQGPSQIYTLDMASGQVQPWTTARLHPALDTRALTEQQTVRWTSFDGRSISGLLTRPPARFAGRRPVLINIHGGPEAQARSGFIGRSHHLVQALGIAMLQPNVRGSSGYGKTFVALDNGRLREDSVKDIGALLDWIGTQPDLDPQRVVVTGGSYGGYMSLAVAATYPQRIAGSIDVVGISNFVSFLENTESYRRDLRRVEYGDERDPAMRAFLQQISPLTHAARITRPLLVVQGKNDPRVPYTEAEQIVAHVRANGTPVWYIRAEDEGHGFARKANADYQYYATVLFLRQVLGLTD